jgi:uncharacterized RDD family membrane protein YckC
MSDPYEQYPSNPYEYQQHQSSTPQFAGWWARVGATLLNGLIASAIDRVFGLTGSTALGVLGLLLALAFWIYNDLYRVANGGQTIGHLALGIRIVRQNPGEKISILRALGRTLSSILNSLPIYLGWLWPLWDRGHRTFSDMICDTYVVKVQRAN